MNTDDNQKIADNMEESVRLLIEDLNDEKTFERILQAERVNAELEANGVRELEEKLAWCLQQVGLVLIEAQKS